MERKDESIKSVNSDSLSNNPFVSGREYTVVADSNGLVRVKVDGPVRGVLVSESPILCSASLHFVRNGYAQIRLTRLWELIEVVDVQTDVTSFDFDADINSLDTEVKLEAYWVTGDAAPILTWRVNAANSTGLTNCHSIFIEEGGTGSTTTGFALAENDQSAETNTIIDAFLSVRLDRPRLGRSHSNETSDTAAADTHIRYYTNKWEDTTTEITSLGIEASVASSIVAGSEFSLYRKPQFNKTKLKLWIY